LLVDQIKEQQLIKHLPKVQFRWVFLVLRHHVDQTLDKVGDQLLVEPVSVTQAQWLAKFE
jgi:hypothetical protein